jgi:hypothetical protein
MVRSKSVAVINHMRSGFPNSDFRPTVLIETLDLMIVLIYMLNQNHEYDL